MKRKVYVKLIALAFAFVLVFSACTPGGGGGGQTTLVLAMIGDGLMKDRLDELLLEFTEQTGVAVETFFVAGSWEEYVVSLQTMIGGGEQLDAAILAIEGVEMFINAGLALPFNDFIAENPGVASAIHGDTPHHLTVPFSRGGNTYAFPFSWNNVVMHINMNRLAEAGLDLPPPNWDRATFMRYMEALTVERDGVTEFAIAVPEPGAYFMQEAWLFNNGAQWMSDCFTYSMINRPEAVEVFQLWQDLIHVYGFAPIPEPGVNQIQQVIQGQVAMGSWGRWPTTAYLAAGFYDVAIQWLPNFRQNLPIFGVDGIFVISNTNHPNEAIQLAAFMSDREFQNAYLSDGNIPASQSLARETISATGIPYNYRLFFDDVPAMRAVSSPPQFAQAALIVERASSEIFINNANVQETLDRAAAEMDEVLSANR